MWHRPRTLNTLADLLYLFSGGLLLAAVLIWLTRVPFSPVREVLVPHPLVHVQASEIEDALEGVLRGNFLTLNLDVARLELEKLPWVRRADVRRRWPSRLEVSLEEQTVAARWGEGRGELVNSYGEVFVANLPETEGRNLPLLYGPKGSSRDVFAFYQKAEQSLDPLGLTVQEVNLSLRLAWQFRLANGMMVYLGREETRSSVAQRLQRLVDVYPSGIARQVPRPSAVDLRYPNGFAMRLAGVSLP